jgi:hypothetical protein
MPLLSEPLQVRTRTVDQLSTEIAEPQLPGLIRRFLYDQLNPDNVLTSADVALHECPRITSKVKVFNSAVATFHAPSDPSGIRGMRREYIRSTNDWWKTGPRYDVAFLNREPDLPGMRGIDVAQIRLFFSFNHEGMTYPCALVHWFKVIGEEPDGTTGMWIVQPELDFDGIPVASVIHLDCIIRACHLVPLFGKDFIMGLQPHDSLTAFKYYYVNKYIDHHAFQLAF